MNTAADRSALPLVVRLIMGESAIGFISRLAAKNGISFVALMEDVGDRRHPDNWEERHWERLAARAFIGLDALESIRRRALADGEKTKTAAFLGCAVRASYLVTGRLRLCPLCLAEGGIHREIWRLVHAVACLEHEVMLVDQCECGRPIHPIWRGRLDDTCPCGKPFAEPAAAPASGGALDGTRWLIQLFGPVGTGTHPRLWFDRWRIPHPFDPLSHTVHPELPPFDGQNIGPRIEVEALHETAPMHAIDALGMIELIGRVVTTDAAADAQREAANTTWRSGRIKGQGDLATSVAHVKAAMGVINDWPAAWHALLDDVAARAPKNGATTPAEVFTTEIGSLSLHPYKGHDDRPINVLVEETDRWLASRGLSVRTKRFTRVSGTARRLNVTLPLVRAAKRLAVNDRAGLRRAYLRAVKKMDRLDTSGMTDEELAEAVLCEIRVAFAFTDDHVSLNVMEEMLNGPATASAGRIWVRPELLTPVRQQSTVNGRWRSAVFVRSDVEGMRKRLADVATPVDPLAVPEGYLPYGAVSKTISSEAYPACLVILDILAGNIPAVRVTPDPTLSGLFLHAATARRRALAGRIRRMVDNDHFAGPYYIEKVLALLSPDRGEKPEIKLNQSLRATEAVKSIAKRNTTQGRTRPMYWYSTIDHLLRARRLFGPCPTPEVEAVLAAAAEARTGNPISAAA